MIRLAELADLERVLQITHDTISKIYSHYYAEGVVGFFREHHSRENVLSDIENGIVWLLEEDGSRLMDFAENKIAEKFDHVHIYRW